MISHNTRIAYLDISDSRLQIADLAKKKIINEVNAIRFHHVNRGYY